MITKKSLKASVGKKIFSLTFEKKCGTLRQMNARLSVDYTPTGNPRTYNDDDFGYITVYDMNIGAFRTVRPKTIKSLKINGIKYTCEDGEVKSYNID